MQLAEGRGGLIPSIRSLRVLPVPSIKILRLLGKNAKPQSLGRRMHIIVGKECRMRRCKAARICPIYGIMGKLKNLQEQ